MSAIVLPLHHLVSHPQRPQPCCHSVLWGFCLLSSSLLHPQPLFCFFYHHNGSCRSTACPARPSAASGLASVTQRWFWREPKGGCSTLLTPPVLHKPAAEGQALLPSPAVTPVGCNAFRGKGGEGHQVLPTTPCILGNHEHTSGAYPGATAACCTHSLPWILRLKIIIKLFLWFLK